MNEATHQFQVRHHSYRIVELIQQHVAKGSAGLELGCSTGDIALGLSYYNQCQMVGVDHDRTAVELARYVATEALLNAEFLCMDVLEAGFRDVVADSLFDFVVWLPRFKWADTAQGRELLTFLSEQVPLMVTTAQSTDVLLNQTAYREVEHRGSLLLCRA